MKNRIILMAAAVAAMVVSCQKEEVSAPVVKTEPMVITAGVETKTSLGTDGKTINWTSDDVIAVFDINNTKNEFSATSVNGASATFAGSVTKGTTQFYAVYPSNLAKSASGSTLSVTIPTNQTPAAGTFAEEHNISVAKGERPLGDGSQVESVVEFKNVCALLKFTVPSFVGTVSTVTVNNANIIAGDMAVDYNDEEPVCSISSGSTSVSMSGTFAAGSTFYFVVAPTSLKNVSVTVETPNNGQFSMQVAEGSIFDLVAGQYKNLGTLKLAASVEATHTTDASGNLNGTELKIALPDAASNIATMNLSVSGAINWSGITSLKWDGVTNEDYPYLPQGSYTLSGSYTLTNGTTVTLGNTAFTVPAPTFTVTPATPITSYSKYLAKNISDANNMNAFEIQNLHSSQPTIASNLLAIYGCARNSKISGASTTTSTGDKATVTAHGTYNVVSEVTFDNVMNSAKSNDCYITGLPYTLNIYQNDGNEAWQATSWDDNLGVTFGSNTLNMHYLQLMGNCSLYKVFFFPKTTTVAVSCKATVQGTKIREGGSFGQGRYVFDGNTVSVQFNDSVVLSASATGNTSLLGDHTKKETLNDSKVQTVQGECNVKLSNSKTNGLTSWSQFTEMKLLYSSN